MGYYDLISSLQNRLVKGRITLIDLYIWAHDTHREYIQQLCPRIHFHKSNMAIK